ncbi:MAG: hypothetical protein KJ558_00805, partial [Gammaproteobacteria bacterium]|nr:hypothetical protein [Gammaproteobacteria bacterium]MBU1960530.1 hypothetical protein [Gammaproteobacteria bacterium]
GKTPEVPVTGKQGGYNVLSIVTAKGEIRFSVKEGKINSESFIEFLNSARTKTPIPPAPPIPEPSDA